MKLISQMRILQGAILIVIIILIVGCTKEKGKLPVLSTSPITDITINSAKSGGLITSDGGSEVKERGVCWKTNGFPTISDSKTLDGNGTGSFTSNLNNLSPGTTYYVCAYATNNAGTAYGSIYSLITFNLDALKDIDGNYYNTVKIGSQVWMAKNLCTTKFNNVGNKYSTAEDIPMVTDNTEWSNLFTPGYCWYNNDKAFRDIYGALYNWYAVNAGKLCPTGWHVPTHDEWKQMEIQIGMSKEEADNFHLRGTNEGYKLKSLSGWDPIPGYEVNGSNESGFSALPVGIRWEKGSFSGAGQNGIWGTATDEGSDIICRVLLNWSPQVDCNYYPKRTGFAVRCIKD